MAILLFFLYLCYLNLSLSISLAFDLHGWKLAKKEK